MIPEEKVLRVVQLSDCHLSADPAKPYRGQDADRNLQKVWAKAVDWGPDLILLSGDLSDDASEASYQRLGDMLRTELPVLALPGNHDAPDLMRRHFPSGPWEGPLAHESGNWMILMCDSNLPLRVEGGFSEQDLDRIREALGQSESDHILVALHHQPVKVAAAWIDKYRLMNPAGFLEVLDNEPRVRCLVWGHIHHHFAEERNGVLLLGAPSTVANSLARSDRFDRDPAGPACRTLELGAGGNVRYGQLFGNAG
jgi:Icc protein